MANENERYIGVFQSTLPRRERPNPLPGLRSLRKFQSTLPRRERLYTISPVASSTMFQSTLPRRERRLAAGGLHNYLTVSIHAPA